MKVSIILAIGILFALLSMSASATELDEGVKAFQAGQYSAALKILVPLANSGNNEAQRVVGEMCYSGQGMKRDVVASFKWSEIAAEGGSKIAQYNLGYLYEKGEGVEASRKLAIDWYTKAAVQGYVAAQHKLGDLYSSSDVNKSIVWYKKAGGSGDEAARRKYATLSSNKVTEMEEANRRYDAEYEEKERQKAKARQEEDTRERNKRAAQEEEDRRTTREYKAALWGDLQNNINRSWAQAEAGSRGSSIEEDRAKAKRLAEFNDNISQMEADPNSDLNRDKRAREREREKDRAALQRADSERAVKRDAAKKVALENDTKRASDERTQADAAAKASKKQQADELKAQQEREKQRLDAERRSQELRDAAERKRVAAAEEARQKAEKEREAQAEKQARAQYLQSITAGTRLVATKCPDGEGKYYATGTRPRIKPEVVSCVDVRYRAYCPGSREYSEGTAHNFVGMAGCFGDTYDISPKPGCKVDQVRIEVVEARECSN